MEKAGTHVDRRLEVALQVDQQVRHGVAGVRLEALDHGRALLRRRGQLLRAGVPVLDRLALRLLAGGQQLVVVEQDALVGLAQACARIETEGKSAPAGRRDRGTSGDGRQPARREGERCSGGR